jgi:hypothetical protein
VICIKSRKGSVDTLAKPLAAAGDGGFGLGDLDGGMRGGFEGLMEERELRGWELETRLGWFGWLARVVVREAVVFGGVNGGSVVVPSEF